MGEPARKLESYAQPPSVPTFEETWRKIELLPEGVTGEILEPGIITTMSRPLGRHRRAHSSLIRVLGAVDQRDGGQRDGGTGWWIEHEPDIRFGNRTTAPDLAGWRVERCPDPPDGSPILILPDFCCEVLSPSTERKDRIKKLPLYARSGVEWIWIVNTDYRFVEVHQTINGLAGLVDSADHDETKKLPPFDIEIDFSRFWILPKNPEPTTGQPST